MPAAEMTNLTITPADIARAAAILDVDRKTRALMALVPKAGMGAHVVKDPSGWQVSITRGEAGCGDAHRFHVLAEQRHLRTGELLDKLSSELVIVARRGQAFIDLPEITVGGVGEWACGRIIEMVARVVGVNL